MPSATTLAAFASHLASVSQDLQADDMLRQMALAGEAEAKDQIAGPLRAWKTGTLARDINGQVTSATTASVGNTVNYAPFVHDGTKYMRGRPYLKAGIDALVASGKAQAILLKWGKDIVDRLAHP